MSFSRFFSIIIVLILGIFFIYNSLNFKLDASSDTLILQNDEDFKYFNYYNEIFPNKNFLVLAIKSNNIIDQEFISLVKEIKVSKEHDVTISLARRYIKHSQNEKKKLCEPFFPNR